MLDRLSAIRLGINQAPLIFAFSPLSTSRRPTSFPIRLTIGLSIPVSPKRQTDKSEHHQARKP
jgi:hypothetical protein